MKNNKETLQLRILATSDIHAHLMDYDYYKDVPVSNFGLVRLAALIDNARQEQPNTLLLDNGDLIQGNPMGDYLRDYALAHGHPAFILMNQLRYDAATLGNHEFNFGLPFLQRILPQAHFPYVNANVVTTDGKPWIKPFALLERSFITTMGRKVTLNIGVIGVLPPQVLMWDKQFFDDYAHNHTPLVVGDIATTVAHYVPLMKAQGADFVVVLAHSGFSQKAYSVGAENAASYLTTIVDIDAIITGHTHRTFPSAEFSEYMNADLRQGLMDGVPCVMPGFWAKYLGVLDFTLTEDQQGWHCIEGHTHLRSLTDLAPTFTPAKRYTKPLKAAHRLTRAKMNSVVGTTATDFYSYLSLLQDDACIQVVADAQRDYAYSILNTTKYQALPLLSAVPLFKVGGRKDDASFFTEIAAGNLTFRDIAALYVFTNQLAIIKVTGRDVKEWLECSASIYHQINPQCLTPQALINWQHYRSYNFDVVKGVSYGINITKPPRYNGDCILINAHSARIEQLQYQGAAIDLDAEFLIATNHYRAYGEKFAGTGEENVIFLTTDEIPFILAQYVQKHIAQVGTLNVVPENNWQINTQDLKGVVGQFETSAHPQAQAYIRRESCTEMAFIEKDAQGFGIYHGYF